MDAFIGIDGGGTKTLIRMVDSDAKVLYEGYDGPTNLYAITREEVTRTIGSLVTDAISACPQEACVVAVCMGAAGVIVG